MKRITALFLLISALGSCCKKGPYELTGINLSYPNLTTATDLYQVRFLKESPGTIVDTILVGELNSGNSYTLFVSMNDPTYEHLLFLEGSTDTDQITDIDVKRDRCGNKIKKIDYKLNGGLAEGKDLSIQ